MSKTRGALLSLLLFALVASEAVKKCLDEKQFKKSSCHEIRKYMSGRWAEVRRMRLPFELFDDYDCITHDIQPISLSEEYVEYRVLSRKNGTIMTQLAPFHVQMTMSEEGDEVCKVDLVYSKPGEDATRIAKEFWFKFYEEGDIMIGYTCAPNMAADKTKLPYRNLAFLYVKPQLPGANLLRLRKAFKDVKSDFNKVMKDIEEEGDAHINGIENDSCKGW